MERSIARALVQRKWVLPSTIGWEIGVKIHSIWTHHPTLVQHPDELEKAWVEHSRAAHTRKRTRRGLDFVCLPFWTERWLSGGGARCDVYEFFTRALSESTWIQRSFLRPTVIGMSLQIWIDHPSTGRGLRVNWMPWTDTNGQWWTRRRCVAWFTQPNFVWCVSVVLHSSSSSWRYSISITSQTLYLVRRDLLSWSTQSMCIIMGNYGHRIGCWLSSSVSGRIVWSDGWHLSRFLLSGWIMFDLFGWSVKWFCADILLNL